MASKGSKKADKNDKPKRMDKKLYEAELFRLQGELVKLQGWVQATGQRVVIVFEGRDAAGKGGAIKRVGEYLNPRVASIVALPAPTERERTQWYFQRYVDHLPAAGEIVMFDRSWYNRAGVERGWAIALRRYRRFLPQCPIFERLRSKTASCCASTGFRSPTWNRKRLQVATQRSDATLEAVADRLKSLSIGRTIAGQGECWCTPTIHEARWNVVESRTSAGPGVNMIAHLLTRSRTRTYSCPKSNCPSGSLDGFSAWSGNCA